MIRVILGVIVGFVVWSIVWIGSDALLAAVSPDWYGKHSMAAADALGKGAGLDTEPTIALISLIRSFVTSIIAGYMTALVAGEYGRSTMILGIILVLVGVVVEFFAWNIAPVWYHVLFILFLLPMTILGGRLRRSS